MGSGFSSESTYAGVVRRSVVTSIVLLAMGMPTGEPPPGSASAVSVFLPASDRHFYVAPYGESTNDGTKEHPLDLVTALSSRSPAQPGDTIWLRGGKYWGRFVSVLNGTPHAPITVRQFPGERATLDGHSINDDVLSVLGAWTVYWGFEVTNSSPQRILDTPGSDPPGGRGTGLNVRGPHTKFINLVVHDTAQGFGVWTPAVNAEVYGNIIYYNGWDAPDRGHGHAVYSQNQTGMKSIVDNVMFNQFSHGLHIFGSSAASLDNFLIEGNISFNNGSPASSGLTRNILVGGGTVAHNITLESNYTYFPADMDAGENNLGYDSGCRNVLLRNNFFSGGSPLRLVKCAAVTMHGNTLYGQIPETTMREFPWNTYHTNRPTGVTVVVRPNRYEPGRGHIVIYNWDRHRDVQVDVSGLGLEQGTLYEVRDVQNYFGPPVARGTYRDGRVTIPMSGLRIAPPVGQAPKYPAHTGAEFGVFVFKKKFEKIERFEGTPRNDGGRRP
jgi:hypothetical protein